jgi:ubiquinone/menaquinone biosynthesis C-methylase UbiE
METTTSFWKEWWNDIAQRSNTDYEVDRGTTIPVDELEKRALTQFLVAVDPKPTDYVLDAGCGTGVNFSRLSSLVSTIVGVDFSGEMLKRAEQRISREGLSNVRAVLGDVTKIDFPPKTFDKVICTSVLQYLNDGERESALREMARVCKTGGRIVLHVKNRTSLYGISRVVLQSIGSLFRKRVTRDHYKPRIWYEEVIHKVGGQIIDYDSFGIITFVPLPRFVVRWLLRLEMMLIRGRWLKQFGVNYKLTVRVGQG